MSSIRIGAAALGLLLGVVGCAEPRDIEGPLTPVDASNPHADTWLNYTVDGVPVDCTPPGCPPSGVCTDHPVLGPPDGMVFELLPGEQLEVAFFCSVVRETGGLTTSPDFQILATVPDGAEARVLVSYDGFEYLELDALDEEDDTFDLSRVDLDVIRFIRIFHQLGSTIEIDAVGAL